MANLQTNKVVTGSARTIVILDSDSNRVIGRGLQVGRRIVKRVMRGIESQPHEPWGGALGVDEADGVVHLIGGGVGGDVVRAGAVDGLGPAVVILDGSIEYSAKFRPATDDRRAIVSSTEMPFPKGSQRVAGALCGENLGQGEFACG